MLGSMVVMYAISWHINLTTKSSIMLTISVICGFVPQMIMSLFSGAWADKYNKKLLIILSDAFTAVVTLALALTFGAGYQHLWVLFVASALRSIGTGIQQPVIGAFLPEIVPQDKLLKINGINQSIMGAVMLIAPMIAGALIKIHITYLFYIDIVTAAIGIGLLSIIKATPIEKPESAQSSIGDEIAIGMRYIFATKWLRQLMFYYAAFSLMFGPLMFLTPLMVIRSFGEESWRLVAHEIVFAAGTILGGLFIGSVAKIIKNNVTILLIANLAFGAFTLVMGFSTNFVFYLSIMFIIGLTVPFMGTCSMTIMQTRTDPEYMGRVFSVSSIVSSAGMPLSILIFGLLADTENISIEFLLIITGAAMVAISTLAAFLKELKEAGEPLTQQTALLPDAL